MSWPGSCHGCPRRPTTPSRFAHDHARETTRSRARTDRWAENSQSDLGDAQKLPNQNRRPSCRPRIESTDSHGGREHDAGFSSIDRSRRRLLGGLPRIEISQSPEGPDSLVAGKNAGNFSIQPFFAKTCLENGYEF